MTNGALIVQAPSTNAAAAAPSALRDIKPPVHVPDYAWVWWTLGLSLLAVGAAYAFWRWWRQQPATPPERIIPPHERARRRLQDAQRLLSEPKPFTVLVSDTLRVYLEERFHFRAPERTTEEFLYELQATNLLSVEQKGRLTEFLSRCDLVKFARYEPTEQELRGLLEVALRLVDETEPPPLAATETDKPAATA